MRWSVVGTYLKYVQYLYYCNGKIDIPIPIPILILILILISIVLLLLLPLPGSSPVEYSG